MPCQQIDFPMVFVPVDDGAGDMSMCEREKAVNRALCKLRGQLFALMKQGWCLTNYGPATSQEIVKGGGNDDPQVDSSAGTGVD